ncbi:MAG: DCC1-like thiol-disulfide oxidoreductase family protein [Candidatus Thermoplasmatota archaeon]
MDEAIVFYDGRCGMCRGNVVDAKRRMRPGSMRFVENSGPEAQAILGPLGLMEATESSLIVLADGKPLLRAEAGLEMVRRFRWPWKALLAFGVLPKRTLDAMYDKRAANRKRDACVLPLPE